MQTFANAAIYEMEHSRRECGNQVGTKYRGPDAAGKEKINCILYVKKILQYAFKESSQPQHVQGVQQHYFDGGELAKYLVESAGWKAYYWNPDVRHPADGDDEHPYSYRIAKDKKYYGYLNTTTHPEAKIPITGLIVNFRPTSVAGEGQTPLQTEQLSWFKQVPFAYGIARGGTHTFVVSRGKIYEVHWDQIGESLYEVSNFEDFPWLSGAVVIPPN